MESGTGDGMGMCVCLVRSPCITCMEVFSFRFCEKRSLPFSVVVFIIFYKCGIWAFLGRLACFICLVICCTDYGVICVCRGVFRGYLVDIAVLFCSYWSKMEYMSILSVQLWQGVLSACYGVI